MPPKIPFTEQQISEAIAGILRKKESPELSKKVLRITIASAIAVVMSAVSGAWTARGIKADMDQNINTIQRSVSGLEKSVEELKDGEDRWKFKHVLEGARQLQNENPTLKVPDPYLIKMRIGR